MKATRTGLKTVSPLIPLCTLLSWPANGQTDPYHILLTNDDGIESPGIQALADALGAVGQVHVVAPCGERSGSSMSVTLREEIHLRPISRDDTMPHRCATTTPAGAVMLAITTLAPDGGFDLVVSGINRGANVGNVAHMSGTVGGAMMGAFYGVPAVAASLGAPTADFDYSARFVAAFVAELKQRPAMPGIVFSINIPKPTEAEIAGVTVAKMGGSQLELAYEELPKDGDERRFRAAIGLAAGAPAESDTEAFMRDMITVTPLLFDWTAYSVLDELRGWGLSHQVAR